MRVSSSSAQNDLIPHNSDLFVT